ncbi:hypothetical protein GEV29_05870 [Aeromicrobium sp. SMF47]|uniref:AbiEi antitoxin N-terminal domain-containing protein n=1 Tax=Aeromicrobium yanjiei TaxID=2662028 RepID=A0A5Q2MLK0_9ACTN|nr:type IV toxin-antitoxin system AbiEi family antitoxin domain-containing protein [Aeromicrobium yanjiei]MRJ76056.1 hypothetical protein [Aeromicrobium yanjiei]QGG42721.1 hypothetical protein GEV26_15795 [Aeromicrobium yanjiei]
MNLDDLIATGRGYVTRGQFLDSGYDDRDIRAAVRTGLLRRRRQGVYVHAATFDVLSPEQQHIIDVRSVADKLGPAVAISHQSACAIHGAAMYGTPLDRIHVTRLDGAAGRTAHGIVHHEGRILRDDDLEEIDGMLVVKAPRAIFELSTTGTVESAIVVMDSGLHLALTTPEQLADLGDRFESWPGARRARYAASLADGRAESPGESRSRYLFRRHNLPTPQLQVPVHDEDGELIGWTDFGWIEYRHLGEFDGKVKYGGLSDDLRTPQEIAFAEKNREDRIRRQLFGVSRWTWREIDPSREHATVRRIEGELHQSRRLYTRNRVIIPLD